MADIFWKYATSGQAYVPLLLASTQNFASTGTVTLASTDATIIKDGSTWAALTNTPTAIAMGSKATFEVVWSASEATAKQTIIQIKDETGALVQDQQINIVTYGSSLAQHAFNLDQAIENSTMAAVISVTSDIAGKVVGAVGSITSTAALPANVVEVKSSTANIDTIVTNIDAAISSRLATTVGVQLSSSAVDAIWDEPIAGHATTSQFGGLIVDNLDANITSRVASTGVVRANLTQIGASTSVFDNLEDDYDGTGFNKANSEIGTVAALTANNDKTGYTLSATGVDAIWDEPIAAHNTTTQFGGMIQDNLDANITSRLATTEAVASVSGNVDGSVASVASTVTANVTQIKGTTANTDTIVTNIDAAITSRLGTTVGAQLSTTAINAVSTDVKSEINDLIFVDTSSESTGGAKGSLGNKIAATNERLFNHHQQDSSTQTVMKAGSTSEVKFAMTVTNTTLLQTVQEATTA